MKTASTISILYHCRIRGTGAEGVHVAGMVNALRAMGHGVAVINPAGCDPTRPAHSGDQGRRGRALRLLADQAPQWLFELAEMLYNLPAGRRLAREVRAHNPGLIYERYAFFNLAGARTARRHGIPLILEVNEMSGLPRVRPQCFTGLARFFEKRLFRRARLIVTVSPLLARRAALLAGAQSRIMVVPNGVARAWTEIEPDPQRLLDLRRRHAPAGNPVIGFAGGLVDWHDLPALLQTAAELRPDFPGLRLLLIGDGPRRAALEEQARRLGAADLLAITGRLDHGAVREHLEIIDVAVIPHANEFRSPIKLFEYMGAGRAVVAPRTEPIRQVVTDGFDGCLFVPRDYTGLRQSLATLLADGALRKTLGARARARIRDGYLWEQHAARIMRGIQASPQPEPRAGHANKHAVATAADTTERNNQ